MGPAHEGRLDAHRWLCVAVATESRSLSSGHGQRFRRPVSRQRRPHAAADRHRVAAVEPPGPAAAAVVQRAFGAAAGRDGRCAGHSGRPHEDGHRVHPAAEQGALAQLVPQPRRSQQRTARDGADQPRPRQGLAGRSRQAASADHGGGPDGGRGDQDASRGVAGGGSAGGDGGGGGRSGRGRGRPVEQLPDAATAAHARSQPGPRPRPRAGSGRATGAAASRDARAVARGRGAVDRPELAQHGPAAGQPERAEGPDQRGPSGALRQCRSSDAQPGPR